MKQFCFIIFLIGVLAIIISGAILVSQKYPFGVEQYKTIRIGMPASEKAGDLTGWAMPYDKVPESEFYVYSLGDENMCIGPDCGIGGYFIECLGGWISGYKNIGDVNDYGLSDAGVDINKQKIITVADKNAKIVGIYPGAGIKNLPYIMHNHRDLVLVDTLKKCLDLLPSRWK